MNFGDLIWPFGYCSLFYEWPYTMFIHSLRYSDRIMFDIGEEMARHRYDIDQYHVEDRKISFGLFQRYEKGHHGNLEREEDKTRERWERTPKPSHTWNRGLLLHWALTGDPLSLRAAEENGRAYYNYYFIHRKLGEKEKLQCRQFRSPGWALENWLALYEYTGKEKYLEWANEIFTKTLLAMEKSNGSCGASKCQMLCIKNF